jgi:D-glycero-beta-D-manno-heptose-7-phosphate kinase
MVDLIPLIGGLDFSSCRVLLLGDLVLDRSVFGTTRRVSREAPIPVVQYAGEESAPGGAANVAANLASLGAEVTVAGLVGDDERGAELIDCLHRLGAKTDLTRPVVGRPTTVKTRVFAGGAGTVRQQVLRLDHEPMSRPDSDLLRSLATEVAGAAAEFDAVVLSDYGYGAVDPGLCARIKSTPVVVDSRMQLRHFQAAHTLKPNLSELEHITGRDLLSYEEIASAAEELRSSSQAGAVLVTLGRDGMLLCEQGRLRQVPVFGDDEIADVTGAGDSVLAAFALALGLGMDRFDAARVATVAGAVAVNHHGTHAVHTAELKAAVHHG